GNLMDQAEALPTVQMMAGIAGMIGILCVVGGIRGVGRALGDDNLVVQARNMTIALVVLAVGYGVIQRSILKVRSEGTLIMMLATLAIFGLVVLFSYLGTLRAASDAMRRGPSPGNELPRAEIVGGG